MKKVIQTLRFSALVAAITVARTGTMAFAADLPSGFMELPYIESDGNQWIATTYTPLCSDRVEFNFRMVGFTDWNHHYLFGSFGTANDKDSFILSYYGNNSGRQIQTWNGYYAMQNGPYLETGIDYDVVFDSGNKSFSINGQTMPTRGNGVFTAQSPFILFGGHTAGSEFDPETTTIGYKTKYRLYSFKVFDKDGDLKCDLVPAYDANATSGVTRFGVYDTVSRAFFKNRGTASFTTDPAFRIVHIIDRAAYGSDEAAGEALIGKLASGLVGTGDTIKLTAGTKAAPHRYKISEPVVLNLEGIELCGDSDDAEATVIDAQGSSACVSLQGTNCRVANLTVRNGFASGSAGATVYACGIAGVGAGTVISNCVVSGCVTCGRDSNLYGGGIYVKSGNVTDSLVCDCVVSNELDSAGNGKLYGGGIYGEQGSKVSRVEVFGCKVYNDQMNSNEGAVGWGYGGGIAVNGTGALIDACYAHDNEIVLGPNGITKTYDKNVGAGVALIGGAVLSNSLVVANHSCNSSAGVYLDAASQAFGCTIASNTVTGVKDFVNSAAVNLDKSGASVRDCLIEGNSRVNAPQVPFNGFAPICKMSSGAAYGSVFRGNDGNGGEGTVIGVAGSGLISNCVFSANGRADLDTLGAVNIRGNGTCVRDSWFVGNMGKESNLGSAIVFNFETANIVAKVQNCFFSGNTGARWIIGGTVKNADSQVGSKFEVENCTFVKNTVSGGVAYAAQMYWDDTSIGRVASVQYFKNCAFHDNNGKPAFPGRYGTLGKEVHIDNCYDSTALSAGGYMPEGHNNLTVNDFDNPGYKDPANDDWSLKGGSGLRDKALKLDWMGDGSKKGVQDMGDGTWTETKAATIVVRGKSYDVGVVVTRNNAHPRVWGNGPDIGCSEYYCPPGLMLLLR